MIQPVEFRAATVAAVSFPQRTIELVVVPYETETVVEHHGRLIRETFARGAFDGIAGRPKRVKVNRDHDVTKVVGRALSFEPDRDEGLVSQVRIAHTPLGDETLQLAHEEMLDASAGFMVRPDGEQWDAAGGRRILKAWLDHIAMTPDPAYPGARVLAVRTAPDVPAAPSQRPDTPNLDLVRSWAQQAAYDRLPTS